MAVSERNARKLVLLRDIVLGEFRSVEIQARPKKALSMPATDEPRAALLQAIERIEVALI